MSSKPQKSSGPVDFAGRKNDTPKNFVGNNNPSLKFGCSISGNSSSNGDQFDSNYSGNPMKLNGAINEEDEFSSQQQNSHSVNLGGSKKPHNDLEPGGK